MFTISVETGPAMIQWINVYNTLGTMHWHCCMSISSRFSSCHFIPEQFFSPDLNVKAAKCHIDFVDVFASIDFIAMSSSASSILLHNIIISGFNENTWKIIRMMQFNFIYWFLATVLFSFIFWNLLCVIWCWTLCLHFAHAEFFSGKISAMNSSNARLCTYVW